jgi:hypothetical protein
VSGARQFDSFLQLLCFKQSHFGYFFSANWRGYVQFGSEAEQAQLEAYERHWIVRLVGDHVPLFGQYRETLSLKFPGSRKDAWVGQSRTLRSVTKWRDFDAEKAGINHLFSSLFFLVTSLVLQSSFQTSAASVELGKSVLYASLQCGALHLRRRVLDIHVETTTAPPVVKQRLLRERDSVEVEKESSLPL